MSKLTAENVREFFDYNPDTGVLTWKVGKLAGERAGCLRPSIGYRRVVIAGRHWFEHRVVWMHVNGELPPNLQVDHINGDKADNRIANLRVTNCSQNQQNRKKSPKHSRTGLLGAALQKRKSGPPRYSAQIGLNGKQYYLGTFDTPEEANAAYLAAKRQMHPYCTI